MMRSMYSGVAGLKTHQTKMDVIGNNIANVNTVGYKSMNVTFNELMYQTTQRASGPNAVTGTGGVNARQIGLGVKMGAINTNITQQGATQTTNNPFDIQITGEAFFIVNNGQENMFTRDGSFYVDGGGNLCMTSNGYNVMGWGVDPENPQNIVQDTVHALRIMSPENMTYPPAATTNGYVSGIIDKNDTDITSPNGKTINLQLYDNRGYLYTARLNFKSTDKEGEYSLELNNILDDKNVPIDLQDFKFGTQPDPVVQRTVELSLDDEKYQWTDTELQTKGTPPTPVCAVATITAYLGEIDKEAYLEANPDEATELTALANAYGYDTIQELEQLKVSYAPNEAAPDEKSAYVSVLDVFANTDVSITPAGGTAGDVAIQDVLNIADPTGLNEIVSDRYQFEGYRVVYNPADGTFQGINGNEDNITMALSSILEDNGESRFEDIVVDFTTTTNYNNSGSSTLAATNGDLDGNGTGRREGEMIGITVQNNGKIYASYDNAQTRLLGQIAVAEFANASGLEKEGDNLYSDTLNSGEFNGTGVDITANGGYMNTGVLEMSNVDLSAEFTEMITTQRGFQANSRIITVSDTLLEELVNLKR